MPNNTDYSSVIVSCQHQSLYDTPPSPFLPVFFPTSSLTLSLLSLLYLHLTVDAGHGKHLELLIVQLLQSRNCDCDKGTPSFAHAYNRNFACYIGIYSFHPASCQKYDHTHNSCLCIVHKSCHCSCWQH